MNIQYSLFRDGQYIHPFNAAIRLALLLGAGGFALPASSANVIIPCPITGTVVISDDQTHVNNGTCDIQSGGVLQNDSTEPDGFGVMNYGTLNVNLGGSLVNNWGVFNLNGANLNIAGIVTNNLSLENQVGQITVQSGGILDNSNSTFGISNVGGTVTLQSGAQMSLGANAGFYNVASSVLNVAAGASVVNNGWMGAFNTDSAIYNVQGQISGTGSMSGGTWNISNGGSVSLNNAQTADANLTDAKINLSGTASLQAGTGNLTTISATGGVALLGAGASLPQLGDGTATSLSNVAGYLQLQDRNFTNQSGHSLNFTGQGQLILNNTTFHNDGTFNAERQLLVHNGSTFYNSGAMTTSTDGFVEGDIVDANSSFYNTGSVAIYGSALVNSGTFINAAGSSFNGSPGVFPVNSGTFTLEAGPASYLSGLINTAGIITINRDLTSDAWAVFGGEVRGNGSISVGLQPDFGFLVDGGTLNPGDGVGTLTINGDVDFSSGKLKVEFLSAAIYDILSLQGGSLVIAPGFEVDFDLSTFNGQQGGMSFDFLQADAPFIGIENLSYLITGLASGLSYDVNEVSLPGGRYGLQLSLSGTGGTTIPEPDSGRGLLLLTGLLAMAKAVRRNSGTPRIAPNGENEQNP